MTTSTLIRKTWGTMLPAKFHHLTTHAHAHVHDPTGGVPNTTKHTADSDTEDGRSAHKGSPAHHAACSAHTPPTSVRKLVVSPPA
eukprot:scaffold38586_cov281-Isochrysis_galbana.AAC.1